MRSYYYKFRIIILTLALGLASVPFFNGLYERWTDIAVKLPEVKSDSPIYVFPKRFPKNSIRFNPEIITEQRDLSLYDFGGRNSDCRYASSSEARKCQANIIKSRNFIWTHWIAKKRAYIILEFNGIDSGANGHVFIEPDENGQWHIVWKVEHTMSMSSDYNGTVVSVADNIRSMKFKRATEDDYTYNTGTFYLSFLGEDGNEVKSW